MIYEFSDSEPAASEPRLDLGPLRQMAGPEAAQKAAAHARGVEFLMLTLAYRADGDTVDAAGDFLNVLQAKAAFGDYDKPLSQRQQLELSAFLIEATQRLQGDGRTGWNARLPQ